MLTGDFETGSLDIEKPEGEVIFLDELLLLILLLLFPELFIFVKEVIYYC